MTPTQTAHRQQEEVPQISTDRLKAFIETRLARRQAPMQIANAVRGIFGIEIGQEQVVPFWHGEITLPTQTEHRPDKESVQFPADEESEPLFTRMASSETPDLAPHLTSESASPEATQTHSPSRLILNRFSTAPAEKRRRQRRPDTDRIKNPCRFRRIRWTSPRRATIRSKPWGIL